ncbi:MAG: hypothetical protein ACR2G6_05825 [Gemmatimonadaceae bacterium]
MADKKGIAGRLDRVVRENDLSRRHFQRLIHAEPGGGPGYSAVWNYVEGKKDPPVDFLLAAAKVLGVRFAWLVTGQGARTDADAEREARDARQRYAREVLERHRELHDEHAVNDLDLGSGPLAWHRRNAVVRFAQALFDAGSSQNRWMMQADRRALLRAAGRFLVEVDTAFAKATRQDPSGATEGPFERNRLAELLLLESASAGWYVVWSDEVLNIFKRRVIGLGERDPHNELDSHSLVDHNMALNEHLDWKSRTR